MENVDIGKRFVGKSVDFVDNPAGYVDNHVSLVSFLKISNSYTHFLCINNWNLLISSHFVWILLK